MIFKALQMVWNVVKLNRAKYGTRHGRGGRRLATTYKVTHRPSGRQRQVAVGGVVGSNVLWRFALFLQKITKMLHQTHKYLCNVKSA